MLKKIVVLLVLVFKLQAIDYKFSNDPIDVVIPCHEKDAPILKHVINGIKKNLVNIRRVIVVSKKKLTDNAEWFSEDKFPFSFFDLAFEIFQDKKYVKTYLSKKTRMGWLFQQLIKLYCIYVIPNISSNVLVLDADTIFYKPINFINNINGAAFFNVGTEYHIPYFKHAKKLIPNFEKIYLDYSGISHCMLFQKPVIDHLFQTVENFHKTTFWKAFCRCIDKKKIKGSFSSEYEIYFNFALGNSSQFKTKILKWKNSFSENFIPNINEQYNYVSYHNYCE